MTAPFAGAAEAYLAKLAQALGQLDRSQIDSAITVIDAAWRRGAQIVTLGNGGSALTALHFITDWNKSLYLATGRPFRGRSLVDSLGLITAYANDIAYEDIFAEQLKNILQGGDLVIAISGSGNSENVIRAVDHANAAGAVTLGLCGYRGGRLKARAQHIVWAPVDDMQLAEDAFAIFGHIVMQRLCAHS